MSFPGSLLEAFFPSQQMAELVDKQFNFISAEKGKCLKTTVEQDVPHAPLPNADGYLDRSLAQLIPALSPEKKNKWRRRSCISGGIPSTSVKTDQQRSDLWRERKHEQRQNGEVGWLQAQK